MTTYGYLDSDGFLINKIKSNFPQDGAVILDFELNDAPSVWHKFNYIKRQWIDARTENEKIAEKDTSVRSTRNNLLSLSDWTQLPDVPLQTKQAWAEYRQALRDITDQPGYPFDIVWPQAPN